jgi:ubiquinone/menaquinone biosynthesis C-methylase UbiE
MKMKDYDKFADKYARGTARLEMATRKHFYTLLPKSLDGKLLLDVGCGSGHDSVYYSKRRAIVHGMDISRKEISMAKERKAGKFCVADMASLPYKNGCFDIVTSLYALQASEDVKKSLLEMIRVAKPKATILVLVKHPIRNLLEGYVNDGKKDYYEKRKVTSYIFNRKIKLSEQGHTLSEYFSPEVLKRADIEVFEEHTDFPASEQVIKGLKYPTYMIIRYRKKA